MHVVLAAQEAAHRVKGVFELMSRSLQGQSRMSSIRLGYRILQLPTDSHDIARDGVEVGRFYDVGRAMEAMKREYRRHNAEAQSWYLIAPNQQILMGPDDFVEMAP